MRFVGAGMIVIGFLGLGIKIRQEFIFRLKTVRKFVEILEFLDGEIRFYKATLSECCREVSGMLEDPWRCCFANIAVRAEERCGIDFTSIYREEMGECMSGMPLDGETRELLLRLFDNHYAGDPLMRQQVVGRNKALLERRADLLAEEVREKSRMAVGLCAVSGILLVVILM